MFKLKPTRMLLALFVAGWFTAGPAIERTAVANHRDRNPWVSEIGEAIDVAHSAKSISDRLRDKFPFCPATSPAQQLAQSAAQIKTLVEQGATHRSIEATLRHARSLSSRVHRLISEDRHVQSDSRLLSLMRDLNRRFDRLESELDKSIARSRHSGGHTHSVRRPPIDHHDWGHDDWGHYDRRNYGRDSHSIHNPPDWKNPFPSNRHRDERHHRDEYRYRAPHSSLHPHARSSTAQRILSTILSDVVDSL